MRNKPLYQCVDPAVTRRNEPAMGTPPPAHGRLLPAQSWWVTVLWAAEDQAVQEDICPCSEPVPAGSSQLGKRQNQPCPLCAEQDQLGGVVFQRGRAGSGRGADMSGWRGRGRENGCSGAGCGGRCPHRDRCVCPRGLLEWLFLQYEECYFIGSSQESYLDGRNSPNK